MKTLTLATFNVREFTKPHKQQQLIRDVTRYRMMDVCVIQETKVSIYQIHLWIITESSLKLNLHTTVMVSLSLRN